MKKTIYTLFLLSFLIIGWSSCKKDENNFGTTTYYGKVYERGSTVGIANCIIYIHGYEVTNPWGSPDMPVITHTYSDSAGNYSVTFEAEPNKRYFIYPESQNHAGNSKGQPVWELKYFGKTVHKDLDQWPLAFVKMKLLNRHKYNDYDQIGVGSNLSGLGLYPGSKDTNFIAVVWGNIPDTVSIARRKGLIYTSISKFGFNVRAWQTDSITIEY